MRVRLGIALLLAGTTAGLTGGAAPAGAATSVTAGQVTLGSTTAGASTGYSIQFATASALPAGGTITLTGPAGTGFTGCSSNCSVLYAVTSATVASAAVNSTTGNTNNQVVLTLASSTIGGGTSVTVTTERTSNPVTAGSKTMSESTSADTTPASSLSYTVTAAPASQVVAVSGGNQTTSYNGKYGQPLVAAVEDAFGNPVNGVVVTFTAPTSGPDGTFAQGPGNCSYAPNTTNPPNTCPVSTGTNGQATSSAVTADATAGTFTVTASAATAGGNRSASFSLTITVPGATAVGSGPVTTSDAVAGAADAVYTVGLTATNALPVGSTITLVAPTGTTLPTAATDYSAAAGAGPAGVTPVTVSSVNVTGTTVVVTIGTAVVGGQFVQVTIGNASGHTVTNPTLAATTYTYTESTSADTAPVLSGTFVIKNGPASQVLETGGGNQIATVGNDFSQPLEATVADRYGNPAPPVTTTTGTTYVQVTFTIVPGSGGSGATFQNGQGSETDAEDGNGLVTSSNLLANGVAGAWTATATYSGSSNTVTYAETNRPAPTMAPALVLVSGGGQSAHVATPFPAAVTVEALDGYGQPAPGVAVTFTAPASGPGGVKAATLHAATPVRTAGYSPSGPVTTGSDGRASTTPAANLYPGAWALVASATGDADLDVPLTNTDGYWLPGTDGSVQHFGDAPDHGSALGIQLAQPIVGMAATADRGGYYLVAGDGGIFSYGDARFQGSAGNIRLSKPIVGMAVDPATGGYWMVASDGGIFSYGAPFYGSAGNIRLNKPIVGMAVAPGGTGYYLVASDGGIFAYGSAPFYGSAGNIQLNKPVVGMALDPATGGYWLVASDGGIFSYGGPFFGSAGNITLAQPISGMAAAPGGAGYWFVAQDGGVFAYGPEAPFAGSGSGADHSVLGMAEG